MDPRLQTWPAMVASIALATFAYAAVRLYQHRRQFKDLPKPPYSFLWGHIKLMGEIFALFPANVHFQYVITTISQKYNLPGLFYIDLWPVGPTQLIVTDPDVALYMTVHKDHPKHPAEKVFVDPIVGKNNIVTAEGRQWKYLHNMIGSAFGISQIKSILPMVAEEAMTYRSILHELAESGETFSLDEVSSNLTFDIMGRAIFGTSFGAQHYGSFALTAFKDICAAFAVERESWNPITIFFTKRKRWAAHRRLDPMLKKMLRERFEVLQRDNLDVSKKRGLSIMDLILRDRLEEVRQSVTDTIQTLDPGFVDVAVTQIKTLLLAGSGTTQDTICFMFMLLSAHPEVVKKLREEHDRVFTPGIEATFAMLQESPNKVNELEYSTNVIKETLRFYPIGNTVRAEDGTGFLAYNGRTFSTRGHMICPVQHTMHMDPRIFPNPKAFDPDRFARGESPRHAWRPFERGSRACLGQNFAMDELRVVLLLTTRDFDFKCANLKLRERPRVPWFDFDLIFGDLAFQEFVFEARPRDGMPMTVKRSSGAL